MVNTRYRESRTLVRRLCRPPKQSHEEFKSNVARLRKHFEQFNLNVAEICQWLMGFRPGRKNGNESTKEYWSFFLDPSGYLKVADDTQLDRYRRKSFCVAAGWVDEKSLAEFHPPQTLLDSIRAVSQIPHTPTAEKLFNRLKSLNPAHLQVLLKSAAEWTQTRYQRGVENWGKNFKRWDDERKNWEKAQPELTEPARNEFKKIFTELEIKIKSPRICDWERLNDSLQKCKFNGEKVRGKNHAPLCVKFDEFLKMKNEKGKSISKKHFIENVNKYVEQRKKRICEPNSKKVIMEEIIKKDRNAVWFPAAWESYLKALNVNEQTILNKWPRWLHCTSFDKECDFLGHQEICKRYRQILDAKPELQPLEKIYREWRKEYLSGPRKPSFKYPSAKKLPMPNIFGEQFFKPDFEKSIIELRLDDMPENEYLKFGFAPWPKDYKTQPQDTEITSAHINFVGVRARVGFRFEVEHQESRFNVSQDEIDKIRSDYPRRSQDQEFLDAARKKLLDSFIGDIERDLKILAVDLGSLNAAYAVFQGRSCLKSGLLKIIKIDGPNLYDSLPKEKNKSGKDVYKFAKEQGLGKEHVDMHVKSFSEGAEAIAAKRAEIAKKKNEKKKGKESELGDHDMRSLSIHTRWMIRDWVRLNAKQIIETAEKNKIDLIVFESLRGFYAPSHDKLDEDKKRRMAFFAYGRIRRKVAEKAVERGMRVVTVPYFKSSQTCSKCTETQNDKNKWETNKKKQRFICEKECCDFKIHSDENAARVIGRVFWDEIELLAVLPGAG